MLPPPQSSPPGRETAAGNPRSAALERGAGHVAAGYARPGGGGDDTLANTPPAPDISVFRTTHQISGRVLPLHTLGICMFAESYILRAPGGNPCALSCAARRQPA